MLKIFVWIYIFFELVFYLLFSLYMLIIYKIDRVIKNTFYLIDDLKTSYSRFSTKRGFRHLRIIDRIEKRIRGLRR